MTENGEPDNAKTVADIAEDAADLAAAVESDVETTGDAADQPPSISPYVMTVYKTDDGGFLVQGVAPDAAARNQLLAILKEGLAVDDIKAEIELAGGVPGDDWQDFVAERVAALNAVNSGSLSFADYDSHLIGVVDTPEDIDIVRTRLAAIDRAMTADLNPIDPRPGSNARTRRFSG